MANSLLSNNPTQLLTKAKVNVSDWVSFTPLITATTTNPDLGTPELNKARWRRVGDSMEIQWEYKPGTGGSAGAGFYLFNLPNGYLMDTNKLTTSTDLTYDAQTSVVGSIHMLGPTGGGSGSGLVGQVIPYDSTKLKAFGTYSTQNDADGRMYSWDAGTFSIIIDRSISINARVPIQGWSSEAEFLAPLVQPKTAFIKELTTSAVASVADSVVTRALNSVSGDTEIVTLSSNQFTLNPGKYQLDYFGSAYQCGYSATFIYDVTNSQYISTDKEHVYLGPSSDVQLSVQGKDTVELTEQTTFELRQFTDITNASGLGNAGAYSSAGNPATQNKVSEVKITKLL